MISDTTLFIISLIDGLTLLFIAVYFVITLSDLECDYINARTCCSKLNAWVVPEIVLMSVLPLLDFFTFHWFLMLANLPLCTYVIYRYFFKPSGHMSVYDPAEIHNRNLLKGYMKESMVKLGCHLVFFFVYLYSMIVSLLS